jgi:hypothetical protein
MTMARASEGMRGRSNGREGCMVARSYVGGGFWVARWGWKRLTVLGTVVNMSVYEW